MTSRLTHHGRVTDVSRARYRRVTGALPARYRRVTVAVLPGDDSIVRQYLCFVLAHCSGLSPPRMSPADVSLFGREGLHGIGQQTVLKLSTEGLANGHDPSACTLHVAQELNVVISLKW